MAVATSIALATRGINKGYSSYRKEPKTHGDAAGQAKTIVYHSIPDGSRILLVDDVFTTGETKYEAVKLLRSAVNVEIKACLISVDRQEIDDDGFDAIEKFTSSTGVPVHSIVRAVDILEYLLTNENVHPSGTDSFRNHLLRYGTAEAKGLVGSLYGWH